MKRSLVLLPGLLCDARLWEGQAPVQETFFDEVVRLEYAEADTVEAIARECFAELDKKQIGAFHLGGLSMGGIIAFEMVRRRPERILSMALMDTTFEADTPAKTENRRRQIKIVAEGRLEEVIIRELKPAMIFPPNLEAVKTKVLAMGLSIGTKRFIAHQKALMTRPCSADLLPLVACPVLAACGEKDAVCPPSLHETMCAGLPQSTLRVIPDCGHLPPLEKPATVNRILSEHFGRLFG